MIKIQPLTASHYQISMPNQSIDIDTSDVSAMMDALHDQAPGYIELCLSGNGLSTHSNITDKALELAGLSGFEAAKMTAMGKVVF